MVIFIVPVSDPHLYRSFRLELVLEGASRPIWSSDRLILASASELSVGLPRGLLTGDSFRLRCFGLGGDGPILLDEFSLRFEDP